MQLQNCILLQLTPLRINGCHAGGRLEQARNAMVAREVIIHVHRLLLLERLLHALLLQLPTLSQQCQ
jgi:hypothetical protein